MIFLEYTLWICCFIFFYNYVGYAVIVYLLNKLKNKRETVSYFNDYPSVSFVVAAFNEEECIEKKIINSLTQNYPKDKIEFIFITDGSYDNTPKIIKRYSVIRLLHFTERKGKSAALNRAVLESKNEILIFSDANTILNEDATAYIARHYSDHSIGGVAGEKKVIPINSDKKNITGSEGFYWKYESLLKKLDSDFYSVVGAAGELFSVRKKLYETVGHKIILDDFIISMKIALRGYRIMYEPKAFAIELPSFSIEDEKKRKIRIAAGGYQAMVLLPEAFYFWKHAKLSFLYISHRILRWTLSPICLIGAFLSSFLLSIFSSAFIFKIIFVLQFLFYIVGILPNFFVQVNKKLSIFKLPYYFIFMNVSVIQGFFRYLRKKQPPTWEKAKRRPEYKT